MKVTPELNKKAVEYLGLEYSNINGVIKVPERGSARVFSLDNELDMAMVMMKMDILYEDVDEFLREVEKL